MIKCYVRIFSVTGVLFFLGMFFSNLSIMEPRQALVDAITMGLVLGLGLSATMGTLHVFKARQAAGEDKAGDIYSPSQSRTFPSRLEYDRVYAAAVHYLKGPAGLVITLDDHQAGLVKARSEMKFTDFGSAVSVRLQKAPDGGTLVTASARPAVPTTLVDFGENLKLARRIEAHLRGLEQA